MNVDQILEHVYITTYDLVLKTNLQNHMTTSQAIDNAVTCAANAQGLARQTLVVS